MPKKQKRILLISISLVVVLVLVAFCSKYIPFNKIFKIAGTPEKEFANPQHIVSGGPHSLYFDFEVDPRSGNTSGLYKGIAHSGQYSTKAFGKNSFSFSVERSASDIGLDNLSAVSMSAWIYVFPGKNDPLGSLVFQASNDNINAAWKGITVQGSDFPKGKWIKISGVFDLSDVKFKPGTKLTVFFWNNSSTDILIDDYYIVFGGPKPRRGDSTLLDLTRSAYSPKFNFPPFPFENLFKEEAGNGNLSFRNISPYDRIFPGYFVSDNRETEDVLVVKKTGKAELFSFCKDKKEFLPVIVNLPPDVQAYFQSADIITGCFSGGGTTQVILSSPNGIIAGEFDKVKASSEKAAVSFKTVFKSKDNPFPSLKGQLVSADLDGNISSEILAITSTGSWKIFRFQKTENGKRKTEDRGRKTEDGFEVIASGNSDQFKVWDPKPENFKITPGRFLQKYQQDILLVVGQPESKNRTAWTLLRFDPIGLTFVPCFSPKQDNLGRTTGLDTLKPGDQFFTGIFDRSGKRKVFRYNRDWRYDLKEIRFNDSTFQVIANMDFTGYDKDFNPKYFELLRIVPGMLITPDLNSFLVIGKNCKKDDSKTKECTEFIDLPELPGAVEVYSIQKQDK
jgi:hypothetical protein